MKARAALLIAIALFAPPGASAPKTIDPAASPSPGLLSGRPAPQAAAAFSDEGFCLDMQEQARAANFRKPAWVDREIRDDGMTVLCEQKTIEIRKFFNVDPDGLGRGWEQRLTAQWSRSQCREPMLAAIRNGWQVVEITRFPKSQKYPNGRELRAVAACR